MRFSIALICLLLPLPALAADYTGTVLAPDNKPVKGATVYFVAYDRPPGANGRPLQLPTTQSDDSGMFHFPAASSDNGEIIAAATGFGLSSAAISTSAPIQIVMRARTDLTMTLRTVDGKPAANVRLSLRQVVLPMRLTDSSPARLWIPPFYRSPWSATTDARGVCVFPGMSRGGNVKFNLDDPRYAEFGNSDYFELSNGPRTHDGPITLQLAALISGRITVGATARPAAGVRVRAWESYSKSGEAVTAADGSYSIARLSPGNYTVWPELNPELEKSWTARASLQAVVAAGGSKTGVDFELIPGVVLTGRVLAADDSKPVSGVELGIHNAAHRQAVGSWQSVITDAAGSFSVRVPPGNQHVYLASDTPASGFGRPTDDEKDVTIAENGIGSVEFRLPRAFLSPIKGTVVDPSGKPIAGASVFTYSEDPPLLYSSRNSILTNRKGMFQTAPVQRGTKVALRVRFGDLATPRAVVVSRDTVGDVIIQLQKNALGSLRGRVLDPQGHPLENARIELIYPIGRYRFSNDAGATDSSGVYTIESLWPDMTYSLEVNREGYGDAESKADLRVTSGGTTEVPQLTLYKRDSTVTGVLLDRDGKPMAGRRIAVHGPRSGYTTTNTDAGGKFQVAVVADDHLRIYYNFGVNHAPSLRAAKAGESNIVLRIGGPLSAAVSDSVAGGFDPSEAVTWTGWLWAVILLVIGSVVTIIINAIAALRDRSGKPNKSNSESLAKPGTRQTLTATEP
jgi:Carboxypeptidase regulatory-like domain